MQWILQPWHWFVLGIAMAIFEIFLPSFTALWFGLAACAVAVLLWLIPGLSAEWQVISWIVLSIGLTVFWFRYLKPRAVDKTKAGLPREAMLGQIGIVTAIPVLEHTGIVRFSMPILGADEWQCRSHEVLSIGDRVSVIDILGNELVVRKV